MFLFLRMSVMGKILLGDECLKRGVEVRNRIVRIPITELARTTGLSLKGMQLDCMGTTCSRTDKFFKLADNLVECSSYTFELHGPYEDEEDNDESLIKQSESHDLSDAGSCSSSSSSSRWEDLMRFRYRYEDPYQQERYEYLVAKKFPDRLSSSEHKTWKKNLKRFYELGDNGKLYRKANDDVQSVPRSVLARLHPRKEVVRSRKHAIKLVLERHNRAHDGRDRILHVFNKDYFFKGIKKVIDYVCSQCETCQEFKWNQPKMVQAIITSRPMELMMFDLTSLKFEDQEGHRHIFVVKDHFTKYHWAFPLKTKQPGPIVEHLLQIFRNHGAPERFHSDNGGEFVAHVVNEAIAEMGSRYTHGRPRRPQTQGLIERSNQTIKTKLHKVAKEQLDWRSPGQVIDWVPALNMIVDNENMAPVKMYKMSPFFCKNGRERNAQKPEEQLTAAERDRVWEYMRKCQEAVAGRNFQFPVFHLLEVGTIVTVRANRKEIKDEIALGPNTARAVIHKISPKQEHYFFIRWLSTGLSMGKHISRKPGSICTRPLSRLELTPLTGTKSKAEVYQSAFGHVLITDTFNDGQCNYVYLSGDFAGDEFSDNIETVSGIKKISYQSFVEWEESQEQNPNIDVHVKAMEEKAAKAKQRRIPKKSKPQEKPKGKDINLSDILGGELEGNLPDDFDEPFSEEEFVSTEVKGNDKPKSLTKHETKVTEHKLNHLILTFNTDKYS